MKSYEWALYRLPESLEDPAQLTFLSLPSDVQQILRLRAASASEKGAIPTDEVFSPYSIEMTIESVAELEVYVARNSLSRVVGAMAVDPRPDQGMLWLDSLAVDPRVRSRGIGSSAIALAERIATRHGFSTIAGNSQPNERTLAFYDRNGFDIYETGGPYLRIAKDVDAA